jgi:hypothetical protein
MTYFLSRARFRLSKCGADLGRLLSVLVLELINYYLVLMLKAFLGHVIKSRQYCFLIRISFLVYQICVFHNLDHLLRVLL